MQRSDHRIALVTYAGLPALSGDDRLLVDALRELGVQSVPVVWDDREVPWTTFDAVVVRSCWDYHLRHAEFVQWVDRMERTGVRLWNPPEILRWNADKRYLRDLAARGISVVATAWVDQGSSLSLNALLDERDWNRAVVKPSISASAHETWSVSRDVGAADEHRFRELTARGDVLVQPFVDVVVTEGEWSLLFLGGEYSHAVLKRSAPGDFRVQWQFGGTAVTTIPPASVLASAQSALFASHPSAADCLYARVDGVVIDGVFTIMELELIEPALFLGADRDAAPRLAAAIGQLGSPGWLLARGP